MVVAKAELNYYPEEVVEREILEERPMPRKKNNKKERKKSRARFKIFGILMAIFIMSFSLFILLGYANISKVAFEINQLENQRNQLEAERSALIADLEAIKSSRRISDEAIYKLGMIYPKEDQVVYISVKELPDVNYGKSKIGIWKGISKVLGLFSSLF